MAERARLTHDLIDRLSPGPRPYRVHDTDEPRLRLAVEVTPTGLKRFVVRLTRRGRQVQYDLGPYPGVSVVAAREQALLLFRNAVGGRIEPRRAVPTLTRFWEVYQERHLEQLAKTTQRAYRAAWTMLRPLHYLTLDEITTADVADLHGRIGKDHGLAQADKVRAALRSILEHATEWGYLEAAPRLPTPYGQRKRDRWLSHDEVRRLLAMLSEHEQP